MHVYALLLLTCLGSCQASLLPNVLSGLMNTVNKVSVSCTYTPPILPLDFWRRISKKELPAKSDTNSTHTTPTPKVGLNDLPSIRLPILVTSTLASKNNSTMPCRVPYSCTLLDLWGRLVHRRRSHGNNVLFIDS